MKLSPRDAARYFAKPDTDRFGLLIYGEDAMRVALKRQQVIAALVGPQGEEEMRLTRLNGSDLRSDPAVLIDSIKAQSFFPGPRVVFVEEATDGLAPAFKAAAEDWQAGDAQLVVTARQLNARSALRKLFEGHTNAFAVGIYDDPPSREEIEAELKKQGLNPDRSAMEELNGLARTLDPGDFRQVLEKIALYKLGDAQPLTAEDVEACAPLSVEAAIDDVLNIVAEGRAGELSPAFHKLLDQGTQPVTLCIGASRHFRALHMAASDPGGAAAGIGKLRPPVPFKLRDRMTRQAQKWGMHRLEQALGLLLETDLQLRSASTAPAMAVMERTLVRLAMLSDR